MRKFGILVKKEIKELLTVSSLIPIVLIMFIFYVLGGFLGGEIEKEMNALSDLRFGFCDNDGSVLSREIADALEKAGCDPVELADASAIEDAGVDLWR